jgi:hypothetical protein
MMLCLPSNTVPPGLSFPTTARDSWSTISVLPEIADAVGGKVEVYVDGGIRRGTDVLKAIACGAHAVFIGAVSDQRLTSASQPFKCDACGISQRLLSATLRRAFLSAIFPAGLEPTRRERRSMNSERIYAKS